MGSPPISAKQRLIFQIFQILIIPVVIALLYWLLPSVWFWIGWEILAALLVAIGCGGEWHLFKNPAKPGHETQHRARELQLIMLVAIGVTMEFLALTHTIPEAIRIERDVAQITRSNLVLAAQLEETKRYQTKIDPLNQPITSVRANVLLFTSGTNIWHPVGDDPAKDHGVSLMIGNRDQTKAGVFKLLLICRYSMRYWGTDSSEWQLEFGPDPGAPMWNLTPDDTVKSADDWDLFLLHASFLRDRPEVLRNSELTLVINSTVKRIPIPPQKATLQVGTFADMKLIGSSASNGVVVLSGP